MKTRINLAMLGVGISICMAFGYRSFLTEDGLSLHEALAQKKVQCRFESNTGFSHYDKCLLLVLKNTAGQTLQLNIPTGMQVNPEDSSFQNLVVTENLFVSLKPGENKSVPVYAMCTEPNDQAPGSEKIVYTLGKPAKPKLKEVAEFISKERFHNAEGQNAVWCVAANRSLENISGYDTAAVRKLQTLVARLTNQKIPPPPRNDDYRRNYYAPPQVIKVNVGGSYTFNFSSPRQVLIGMYNTHNILVRELYKNQNEPAGKKTIPYAFDASVYTDSVYYMRMFVNGEKRLETKMDMN